MRPQYRGDVVIRFARVNHGGLAGLRRQRQLRLEGAALGIAWGVVVVIVEPGLAHGDDRG